MYQDKTLVCKECGQEFVLVSRNSMQSAASRTSPSAARLAVTLARTPLVVPVSSSPQFAQHAAARQRFPLSPSPTVPSTAASALQR